MFDSIIIESSESREDDLKRWRDHDINVCQLCGAKGQDKRTLLMWYFYQLNEIIPEFISLFFVYPDDEFRRGLFYLRTCKHCRSVILDKLREAATICRKKRGSRMDHDGNVINDNIDPEGNERTIPFRLPSGETIWLSEAEWRERHGYGS